MGVDYYKRCENSECPRDSMADRRRINNGARIENLIPIHYPQLHQWIESLSFEQQVRQHSKCSNTKEESRVYYYLSPILSVAS